MTDEKVPGGQMAATEDTSQVALICGSQRILVDKATLFTKLELFSKNPGLMGLQEYQVRADVSSSVLSTFIELIGRTEFHVRDEDVEGLGRLAAELGHPALAAACRAQRSEGWEGLKGNIASMRERQEAELLSIREELASLRQSLPVRGQDVSGVASDVSGLPARQDGDEREVPALSSSVLPIETLVKSVCEKNDQMTADISAVKRDVGRVMPALNELRTDIYELKGNVCSIETWREATEAALCELTREVREGLGRETRSVEELRATLPVEVAELKKEVGLLRCAEGALEAEFGEVRKQFEAEHNYRRFCELCYGVCGCDKSPRLGVRFLELAADAGHSDAQYQYSQCHCEGCFVGKDYAIGWRYAELSGSSGNAAGQFRGGYCLYNGFGVARDFEKAAGWYKLSADQGYARGKNGYGVCLESGRGVGQDLAKAAAYYRLSADQGNTDGQNNYAWCLQNGHGVQKDLAKAADYYKLSADQGHASGQYNYGLCLQNGWAVGKDLVKAAEYYKLSADQGNGNGQYNYASCLEYGHGLEKDLAKAAHYYQLAADQGRANAPEGYARCSGRPRSE
jgi:TPR repeat protein